MSFDSCLLSERLTNKLPVAELRKLAAKYTKAGVPAEEAMIRVLRDKLQLARMEEKAIIKAVRTAWEAKGGKPRPIRAGEPAPAIDQAPTARPEVAKENDPAALPDLNEMFTELLAEEAAAKPASDDLNAMFGELLAEVSGVDPRPTVDEVVADKPKKARSAKTKTAKTKPLTAAEQRLLDVIGARVGDIVTPTFDQRVGYLTSGKPMRIERVGKDGNVWFKDPETGSGTSEKLIMLESYARNPAVGLKWSAQPAANDVEPGRGAGESAASAAKNLAGGTVDVLDALGALFGGNSTFGSGPVFNDETFAKAIPLFKQALAKYGQAGQDIRDTMRTIIKAMLEKFGYETTAKMQPYVVRFTDEYQAGKHQGENENADERTTGSTARGEGHRADEKSAAEPDLFNVGEAVDGKAPGIARESDLAGRGQVDGAGVPGRDATADRKARGEHVRDGQSRPGERAAEPRDTAGSGSGGREGARPDGRPAGDAGNSADPRADAGGKLAQQRAAADTRVKLGDRANIDETLPYLLAPQRDDVHFAERRFDATSQGKMPGVMFTNGTGTGKTATGAGIIARQVRAGKTEGIIVVPNTGIAKDWIEFASRVGVDIKMLDSTSEHGGSGPTITTYANFGANKTLADRDYDWMLADESHYLMAAKDGTMTDALQTFRALTRHPAGFAAYSRMRNRDLYQLLAETENKESARAKHLFEQIRQREEDQRAEYQRGAEPAARPKAIFLSATPFAYVKSVDYAEGYLFNYPEGGRIGNSNQDGRAKFFVQHFGYRIRYHKLTEPDGNVDVGLMARQFNSWLKSEGALSGRMLEVDADYGRRFIKVESALGEKIDEGMEFMREHPEYKHLYQPFMKSFDYLKRRYLLEAIKAKEAVPIIQQHLAMGRKVAVIHDYKKGGAFNPFHMTGINGTTTAYDADMKPTSIDLADLAEKFKAERPDLVRLQIPAASALQTLRSAFPNALVHNGDIPEKQLEANKRLFNDDASGRNVIILQSDKGREGISLHDTTGAHPRVEVIVGMAAKPTALIQLEGRIYRTGQKSNAAFDYVMTGTAWERWTFAQTIAERTDIAEALAMGDDARALKDAIVEAFENAGPHEITEQDGTGGKARDRQAAKLLTDWDRAKSFYYGQLKRNSATKALEGKDYFATPEPVGLKMVEWADIRPGEDVLEPSAGHGAIARWFPTLSNKTINEPSTDLIGKARLVVDGAARFLQGKFEDLNIVNKYDAIVMNPPFGVGGSMAIPHLAKAYQHLRDGGRIVALLPRGPAADGKLEKFLYGDDAPKDLYMVADVEMPSSTFSRAGTAAMTHIVVLDKISDPEKAPQQVSRSYVGAEDVDDLFDRIQHSTIPGRVKTDQPIEMAIEEQKPAPKKQPREAAAGATGAERYYAQFEFKHTKTGDQLYGAAMLNRTSMDTYKQAASIAKQHGGWYNKFVGGGALRGFLFKSDEDRAAFMQEAGQLAEVSAGLDKQNSMTGDLGVDSQLLDHMESIADARGMVHAPALLAWVREQDAPGAAPLANWLDAMGDATVAQSSVVKFMENSGNQLFARAFNPGRRTLLAAMAAAAVAGRTKDGAQLGKATPIPAEVIEQRVTPRVEKILRDGRESGAAADNGITLLRRAIQEISFTGPKEIRAFAHQVAQLLPVDGKMQLTIDDTTPVDANGTVSLAPLHLRLFTAEGRTGLTYETVLHEALHVALAARYRSLAAGMVRGNDAILGLSEPAAAAALEQFDKVWNEFRDLTASEQPTGALGLSLAEARGNPDEFFVRALTDPTLQAYMAGKRYEGKTLWERFKDWIKTNLLGLEKGGTAPSWLDAALAASNDVMGAMDQDAADFSRMRAMDASSARGGRNVLASRSDDGGQVNTPAFRRWFGDSKVVDEQGRPLVVYHGTNGDFSSFSLDKAGSSIDSGFLGTGFYFTDSASLASTYANVGRGNAQNVMPVYLSLKNPYMWGTKTGGVRSEVYGEKNGIPEELRAAVFERAGFTLKEGAEPDFSQEKPLSDALRAELIARGHDGVIATFKSGGAEYVAFSPEQIKSATGNNGNFDPNDPNIMYSRRAPLPAATWAAPVDSRMDNVVHALQDKHIDMKQVVKAVRDTIGDLGDKWDPYLQDELFHGRSATGFKDFLETELRPLLVDMQARGVSMDDLETYLHMRHAEEANARLADINDGNPDGLAGVGTKEAKDYLANLPPAKAAAYAALAARVDAIIKGTQKALVDYGLEKQDTIDAWNATYQHYVPLHRADMDKGQMGNGTGRGYSTRGAASKQRTGSKRDVVHILANIAMARERAITRGEKNRVAMSLYGLALQAPNPSFWKPINPQKNRAALEAELLNIGLSPAEADAVIDAPRRRRINPNTGMVESYVSLADRNLPNVVSVRINGEDRFLFFNEKNDRALRMAQAINNVGEDALTGIMGLVASGTRYFAAVNTQFNPVFGVVNLVRDVGEGAINLSSTPLAGKQAEVLAEAGKLFGKVVMGRGRLSNLSGADLALWHEFETEGGITGYRAMFSRSEDRNADLRNELARMTSNPATQTYHAIKNWLSDYNEALENITRLAAYKVGKANGLTNQRAASLAKNLTVNFNRKGAKTRMLGALYAFFNAAVQGTARMAQTLAGPAGRKIIAGGLLLGVMQALLLAGAGFDDEDIPDFVRAKNLIIPVGGKSYLTVPLPLGFAFLPGVGRIATEFALHGGKQPGKYGARLLSTLLDTANPLGSSTPLQMISPTVADPIAALSENKDWTGKPIARQDMSQLHPTPGHTRAKETASAVGKALSHFFNAASGGTEYAPGGFSPTPDQIDYFIGQFTGGVGREAMKLQQTVASKFTGEENSWDKVPLFGRFYGDVNDKSAISTKFYDNVKELADVAAEVDGRHKAHVSTADYRAEHPEWKLAEKSEMVLRDLAELGQQRRRYLAQGDKARVKEFELRIRTRMQKFNDEVAKQRATQ